MYNIGSLNGSVSMNNIRVSKNNGYNSFKDAFQTKTNQVTFFHSHKIQNIHCPIFHFPLMLDMV